MITKLQKATRQKAKIRLGLSAVSGGGKTYSALLIAYGLCEDWNKIAVIDTENGSAHLYAHLGNYNVAPLEAPFNPERYIELIDECEKAGMEVIIIDSISHEWEGVGGVLDLCDKIGGGFSSAWKQMTPRHEKFKQKILQSKAHIITTARRKQEYILQEAVNKQGKTVQMPVKSGLKEITREGWEYELTINLELDINHNAKASKDRTGLLMNADPFIPSIEMGKIIKKWCDIGVDTDLMLQVAIKEAIEQLDQCNRVEELTQIKEKLHTSIIEHPDFKKAGIERYKMLQEKSSSPNGEKKEVVYA